MSIDVNRVMNGVIVANPLSIVFGLDVVIMKIDDPF